jgi:outer membrane protein OmpA-like peptidoglycan-associated protein
MARLATLVALLILLSLLLLWGVESSAHSLRSRDEARRLVAAALAGDKSPEQQTALFRRARKTDPTYTDSCERGAELARRSQYAPAAASFRSCLESDPRQAFAYLAYARSLLPAQGSEAYVEARSALRHFLEQAPEDPVASRDTTARRLAEGMILDLETLLEGKNGVVARERYSADELRRILLRPLVRGASQYDGPRVPLRLGFRPGSAILGTAAAEQLREVAQALQDGSLAGSRIQIEGHTDSVEGRTRKARVEISLRRAEAVKEVLVRRYGIPAGRLSVAGFADDNPLQPNGTEAGRAVNRRVELVNATTQELVQRDVRDRPGS